MTQSGLSRERAVMNMTFRPYRASDKHICIDIFDANCPEYFAPNERPDYEEFLDSAPQDYEICERDGRVLGAFGLIAHSEKEKTINWILLDPQAQGMGVGSDIMRRVIHRSRESDSTAVRIAASHKSAPFFAHFGATTKSTTKDGWGPGMDRVDMEISI